MRVFSRSTSLKDHDRLYIARGPGEAAPLRPPIAIITENFPPCSGGGIAEWAYGLAQNLPRFGFEVTVLSRWKKGADLATHVGEPFSLWPMKGHDWRRYRLWYSLYHLTRWARRYPAGVLVATTWELAQSAALIKRHYPIKLVVLLHGLEVSRLKGKRQSNKLGRVLHQADVVVAVSRFTRQQILGRVSLPPERVRVIAPGVDPVRFCRDEHADELRARWGLQRGQPILLTLARVIPRKGHDTVIRCLPSVVREFPQARYVIAGPWRDSVYRRLRQMAADLDLTDRVIFTGFVDQQSLSKWYSLADIYIMVSRESEDGADTEGFGITFLEAGACETPVIGSRSGGIPDAVEHGHTGFLVQPDDPDELSSRIRYLLGNPHLAREMGKNGRKRVQEGYTWPSVTERLVGEIETCLDG